MILGQEVQEAGGAMDIRVEDSDLQISVVVPHFNQGDQLRRCLESLHSQTFDLGKVEIVVVDNGSDVLPSAICAEFPDVRLEHEPRPGPGPARNRGVGVSRAPILAFIDADCFADHHWLATIATVFDDEQVQIIGGDVRIAVADASRSLPWKPTRASSPIASRSTSRSKASRALAILPCGARSLMRSVPSAASSRLRIEIGVTARPAVGTASLMCPE